MQLTIIEFRLISKANSLCLVKIFVYKVENFQKQFSRVFTNFKQVQSANCERRTLKLMKTAGKLVRINIFILLALASNVFNTKRIFPRQMQLHEGGKQKSCRNQSRNCLPFNRNQFIPGSSSLVGVHKINIAYLNNMRALL